MAPKTSVPIARDYLRTRRFGRPTTMAAIACLAVLALVPGCTTGRGGGSESNEDYLHYALTTDPTDLDPARVQDGTTIDLLQQVYAGLVRWNEDSKVEPDLAGKIQRSADGRTYTFALRRDVRFHNGRQFTADDVKYSLERACDPRTKSETAPTYLKDIVGAMDKMNGKASDVSGIKVIDPYTVQITIDAFKPYWLGNMTYPTGYVVCKEAIEANGGRVDVKSSIGTGPFKLSSYKPGYSVTLVANADYYGGKPALPGIERPIIKDGSTRLSKYEAGELDYLEVSAHDMDNINHNPKLKSDLASFRRAVTWYVGLNQLPAGSPFRNRDVRRAFAMAVDKAEVARVAMKDTVPVANGIVPPEIPGANLEVHPVPFDPSAARALLAKAGYPGGAGFPTLTFSFRQDQPEVQDTAQVIAEQLKKNLNVSIQIRPMDWGKFLDEYKTLPLYLLRWSADYMDPQDYLSIMLHTNKKGDHPENGVGYSNAAFDTLCDRADIEHDPDRRKAFYNQAEQIAVDDAPWIPLYYGRQLELVKPRVHRLRDSYMGHLPHTTTSVAP